MNNKLIDEIIDGVEIIDLYDLSQDQGWEDLPTYEEECEALRKWCEENNASYYGATSEEFFLWKAVDLAQEEGKPRVVVDNLS